ncbi:DNA polymerase III subunit beta [candidate division KSB1 bacterium]|nr:DNA polymerase III subunit beta [candidate division KSB1 bacterium]
MRFVVQQALLLGALQKIIGVIPAKTTISILSSFLFDLNGKNLSITGTDLEISASTSIDVEGQEDGSIAIPARIILEIVRELPDIPLDVSSDEDNKVSIMTEKGVYRISGESKDDFPNIIFEDSEGSIEVDSSKLHRMITKTMFAVSTDELRMSLMGVYFQIKEDELRMVSTDGHRLVKIVDTNFRSPAFALSVIVPTKALNLLIRNIESTLADANEKIAMQLSENHAIFSFGRSSIYSKTIEAKYPKYENVIPKDNEKRLLVNRDSLIASTRRVSIFSNSITHQIRFSIAKNKLEIVSEDLEFGGDAKEELPADYNADDMEIGYNSHYILDILKNIDTDELVILLNNPTSAAIFTPISQNAGEDLMMLLMPIRLVED